MLANYKTSFFDEFLEPQGRYNMYTNLSDGSYQPISQRLLVACLLSVFVTAILSEFMLTTCKHHLKHFGYFFLTMAYNICHSYIMSFVSLYQNIFQYFGSNVPSFLISLIFCQFDLSTTDEFQKRASRKRNSMVSLVFQYYS